MKKLMIVTLTLFSAAAFAGSPMEKGADRHVQRMTQELNLSEEQQQEVQESSEAAAAVDSQAQRSGAAAAQKGKDEGWGDDDGW